MSQIFIGPDGFPVGGLILNPEQIERALSLCSDVDWRDAVCGYRYGKPAFLNRRWLRTENQRQQGACQGWAIGEVGEVCFSIATGEPIQFSAQWCYTESQKFDGIKGDNGSTLFGGAKMARERGFCLEDLWKYTGNYDLSPPGGDYQACVKDAATRKLETIVRLKSHSEIVEFLGNGVGSVWVGRRVDWDGGHATHLPGYFRANPDGRNPLDEHNQWGVTWCDKGWKQRSPEEVDHWFRDSYTVVLGGSDMKVDSLKPRPVDFSKELKL